mgnify:CR=1 FL=1
MPGQTQPVRATAARLIAELLRHKGSLASLLPHYQQRVPERDRGLLQELCYGSLRWQPRLEAYLGQLVTKPLKAKDADIQALLLLGLYQLTDTRIPDHAAIGATVEAAKTLKKPWASGLINGVLRRFQREHETLDTQLVLNPEFVTAHPQWLIERLKSAWPEAFERIIEGNNSHPPLTLRLNLERASRADYIAQLGELGIMARPTPFSPQGLILEEATDLQALPLFAEGGVSVQDEAAQLSAGLLELAPGQRVLDACSAPGGKTGHILETQPNLAQLVALDLEERRLKRVRENLARLGVEAQVVCGDAGQPDSWWNGQPFDRILLDAPCSATGIIRRQPDIKLLRGPADIAKLVRLQARLLDALWPLLAPGGKLLYASCSIMPEENSQQVQAFLARHPDAVEEPITADWGQAQNCGRQLLPNKQGHDGFYYARLRKVGPV